MENPKNVMHLKIFENDYKQVKRHLVKIGPDQVKVFNDYESLYAEKIKKFKIRSDDVFVAGYLKAGTTWLQEIVWCIVNNLNFDLARSLIQEDRVPRLERGTLVPAQYLNSQISTMDYCDQLSSPRTICTHLPWSLLPDEFHTVSPKLIYICRNPKDIIVSLHNMYNNVMSRNQSLSQLVNRLINDDILNCPFFSHVEKYFNASKKYDNILFLRYETLKVNTSDEIKRIARFLGKDLTDTEVIQLEEYTSFESMKNNPATNKMISMEQNKGSNFMFKGKIGGYKESLSTEMIEKLDRWIHDNVYNTELEFLKI